MRTRRESPLAEGPRQDPPALFDVAASFLRHAPAGVIATDREGRILSLNPTAARLLGYSPEVDLTEGLRRTLAAY